MKVLLSIKPQYAAKIFSGIKKYEYRRSIFKKRNIEKIIVYATAPISKIIGEFEIESVLYEDLDYLWEITNKSAGISKEFFYNYFSFKEKGYAIKIKNVVEYHSPIILEEGVNAPQSFIYIKEK